MDFLDETTYKNQIIKEQIKIKQDLYVIAQSKDQKYHVYLLQGSKEKKLMECDSPVEFYKKYEKKLR